MKWIYFTNIIFHLMFRNLSISDISDSKRWLNLSNLENLYSLEERQPILMIHLNHNSKPLNERIMTANHCVYIHHLVNYLHSPKLIQCMKNPLEMSFQSCSSLGYHRYLDLLKFFWLVFLTLLLPMTKLGCLLKSKLVLFLLGLSTFRTILLQLHCLNSL